MQIIVAVDIDEVLADQAGGFIEFSRNELGIEVRREDYREEWSKAWGVDRELAHKYGQRYIESDYFLRHAVVPDAYNVLSRLKKSYRLIAVTSRTVRLKEHTYTWMNRHFDRIFDDIIFSRLYDNKELTTEQRLASHKGQIIQSIGAKWLIDDQLKHCLGCADMGINTLLFGDYAWNQHETNLPAAVIRVNSWHEVEEVLSGSQ